MSGTRTQIHPIEAKRYASHFGWAIDNDHAGLINREARLRGAPKVVCECGNGPDPAEAPSAGLYIDDEQGVSRVCGMCWLQL